MIIINTKDGCVVLTKLVLAFGENQLSVLFDGFLSGNDQVKQFLLQFMNLIMVIKHNPRYKTIPYFNLEFNVYAR